MTMAVGATRRDLVQAHAHCLGCPAAAGDRGGRWRRRGRIAGARHL